MVDSDPAMSVTVDWKSFVKQKNNMTFDDFMWNCLNSVV